MIWFQGEQYNTNKNSQNKINIDENIKTIDNNYIMLVLVGFVVGLIAMSIGVGGSVMLTPILATYLHYNLKTASSMSLFFVIFSSLAGFISLSVAGQMYYYEGSIVGLASLFGVYIGIWLKNIVNIQSFKIYISVQLGKKQQQQQHCDIRTMV